jgi:hypothetical protein
MDSNKTPTRIMDSKSGETNTSMDGWGSGRSEEGGNP